jgi:hypothetical protein
MMIAYETLIREELFGETPKERYENLMKMKRFLCQIAYPGRGTLEEGYDIQDFAIKIQESFSLEQLNGDYEV